MGPKSAKLTNVAQISTNVPPIYQQTMLEGPESLECSHKLILPENVPQNTVYTVILGNLV